MGEGGGGGWRTCGDLRAVSFLRYNREGPVGSDEEMPTFSVAHIRQVEDAQLCYMSPDSEFKNLALGCVTGAVFVVGYEVTEDGGAEPVSHSASRGSFGSAADVLRILPLPRPPLFPFLLLHRAFDAGFALASAGTGRLQVSSSSTRVADHFSEAVTGVAALSGERTAACAEDGSVRVWEHKAIDGDLLNRVCAVWFLGEAATACSATQEAPLIAVGTQVRH